MKRNNPVTSLCLLTILCMLLGCTDIVFEEQNTYLPNGKICLVMNYDIPQGAIVETKALGNDRESTLQNAVLLVFEAANEQQQEGSDRLIHVVEGDVQQNQTVNFIVSSYKGHCRVKVLANLDEQALSVVRSYQTVGSPSATTIQKYKELKMTAASLQGDKAAPYLPLYSAEPTVFNGINSSTDLTLTLKRIYARIDVAVDPSITDFTLHEIYLHNGYISGRFEPYLQG
ncbi:MAG: FimB/Mfa2 family fimbrial subunit, partial [Bacteroidales bacterium]